MNHFIDITRPIAESMVCWPGKKPPECSWEKNISDGDHCNASSWNLGAHTGTHMDAPFHFVEGGKTVDQIGPEILLGEAVVLDLANLGVETLDAEMASQMQGVRKLLVRSRHSYCLVGPYLPHGPLLTSAATSILIDQGLVLIGTDRYSVDDSSGLDFPLHRQLMRAGTVIVEGLLLANIASGPCQLIISPLLLVGAEASPVRAFLRPHPGENSN